MAKKPLRELPREQPGGSWPSLQVSPQDRHYTAIRETPLARQWRIARASLDLVLLDMGLAGFKGALFGTFTFAIIFSFAHLRMTGFCWLVGWHWAFAIGAVLLSLILIGLDWTLLLIGVVALYLSFSTLITHPILILWFVGGGVLLWLLLELWPRRSPLRITGWRRPALRRRHTGSRPDNKKRHAPGQSQD